MFVSIIITNPNHHVLITLPIARALKKKGVSVSYISLCELRGFKTPQKIFNDTRIDYNKFNFDRPASKPAEEKKATKLVRAKSYVLREVFWYGMVKPKLNKWLKKTTHVILLNDTAYPGNYIIKSLKDKGIKSFLMQEGIRFPLPVEQANQYGNSGVDYLLAWGQKSASYFRQVVQPNTAVLALGSPGYDKSLYIQQTLDSVPKAIKRVAIFGNPIDDQQFVTSKEKMAIYIDLARSLVNFAKKNNRDLEVFFKNHPRELPEILRDKLAKNDLGHIKVYESSSDIDIVINSIDAGIVFASTVGVNVVIHGKKLAILKLKNHDYLGDYVQDGVAYRLNIYSPEIEQQLQEFLGEEHYYFTNYRRYLDEFASNSGKSDLEIANFIISTQ